MRLTFVNYKNMNFRLKKWIDLKKHKPSELADNIGVNRATVSHILSGRNKPSIDFLEKLLNVYPDLNANWLITGIGHVDIVMKEPISSKKLAKVVVLYDDNTFDELKKTI